MMSSNSPGAILKRLLWACFIVFLLIAALALALAIG